MTNHSCRVQSDNRPVEYRNALTCRLVAVFLLLPPIPLVTQRAVSPKIASPDWIAANYAWLRGQLTPNQVVPNPA